VALRCDPRGGCSRPIFPSRREPRWRGRPRSPQVQCPPPSRSWAQEWQPARSLGAPLRPPRRRRAPQGTRAPAPMGSARPRSAARRETRADLPQPTVRPGGNCPGWADGSCPGWARSRHNRPATALPRPPARTLGRGPRSSTPSRLAASRRACHPVRRRPVDIRGGPSRWGAPSPAQPARPAEAPSFLPTGVATASTCPPGGPPPQAAPCTLRSNARPPAAPRRRTGEQPPRAAPGPPRAARAPALRVPTRVCPARSIPTQVSPSNPTLAPACLALREEPPSAPLRASAPPRTSSSPRRDRTSSPPRRRGTRTDKVRCGGPISSLERGPDTARRRHAYRSGRSRSRSSPRRRLPRSRPRARPGWRRRIAPSRPPPEVVRRWPISCGWERVGGMGWRKPESMPR
jgi:hypothetical protein